MRSLCQSEGPDTPQQVNSVWIRSQARKKRPDSKKCNFTLLRCRHQTCLSLIEFHCASIYSLFWEINLAVKLSVKHCKNLLCSTFFTLTTMRRGEKWLKKIFTFCDSVVTSLVEMLQRSDHCGFNTRISQLVFVRQCKETHSQNHFEKDK